MNNTVVYEDSHIVCIRQPGRRRDATVITFGEMLMRPSSGNRIWAGKPIQKLHFPAIGFVAKSQNWFPRQSVLRAIDRISPNLQMSEKRIGYGFSMGGWATIYYARYLNLNAAIAFSPQFSINPEEVSDRRFSKYFDRHLNAGMAIGESSGAPLNIVVCDPYDSGDFESGSKICANISSEFVKLPNVGHGSVKCVTSTKQLEAILTAALHGDMKTAVRDIRVARKQALYRPVNIAHKVASKRPELALSVYRKYSDSFPKKDRPALFFKLQGTKYRRECFLEMSVLYGELKENASYLAILALFLKAARRDKEASACIGRAMRLSDSPHYRHIADKIRGL